MPTSIRIIDLLALLTFPRKTKEVCLHFKAEKHFASQVLRSCFKLGWVTYNRASGSWSTTTHGLKELTSQRARLRALGELDN